MYPKVFPRRANTVSEALTIILKSHGRTAAEYTLKFCKTSMSYLSFRQKGKIHEAGALRTKRREKYFQRLCDKHLQTEHPTGPSTCKPGLASSHFSEQEARALDAEANCPGTAANRGLSWYSTPVSASLWQGPSLTLFIALLQQRLTNWTQPRKTKEL